MTRFLSSAGVLALCTGTAMAGGFERSGNPIGFMFEKGSYAELSFGLVSPTVSGIAGGVAPSGDVGESYTQLGVAFKMDLNEKLSLGMQIDPSFGADITYPLSASTYPIRGTNAELNGDTLALIARYKINENFSVHGGLRSVGVGGNVSVSSGGAPFYSAEYETDRDLGYLIGAAYEKPEIALRVALTYASSTEHDLETSVFGTPVGSETVELPQSWTLDFQSGIAANTLVFGSIRWAEWTATELNSILYPVPLQPLIGYDNDVITYNLGVGRKFSDTWSGAVSLGYEKANGGIAFNLAPTDGYLSVGLGATYTRDNMKITGGVRYVMIGDATALSGASEFTDNSALGVGIKVGFSF
jgi:long-chain fatty acid transport protein